MNKNTLITTIIILAILVIGGIVYYSNTSPAVPITEDANSVATDTTPAQARVVGAPVVITRSAVTTDTTVVLIGTVTPNGALTTYWYEYGTTSNLGSKSAIQLLGSGFANFNTPAYITGLTKKTVYYYRLVAENQYGKVAGTQASFQTTDGIGVPIGGVPVVKTLAASSVTRNTVNLNAEVDPNKASTEYWFEYGKDTNLGDVSSASTIGNNNAKVSESVSISGLDAGTTYFFRINAQNQFGTVNGAILSFKTTNPITVLAPKATTQKASNISSTTATLHAVVNPNGADTNYWFEYSLNSNFKSDLLKSTNQMTLGANENNSSIKIDVSGLSTSTTYFFRVVAKNSVGTVTGNSLTFRTDK